MRDINRRDEFLAMATLEEEEFAKKQQRTSFSD